MEDPQPTLLPRAPATDGTTAAARCVWCDEQLECASDVICEECIPFALSAIRERLQRGWLTNAPAPNAK